ncbi:SDA1-domain-containing protein [Kockovaella imperatae]|uniref:Protein SDA1 n=1 Tax=Kockovaella imperatae TaxID=4999 RepID=A0A1Y1UT41_9TREE|nr:SDA1-domain-containing protein [Kockovaella imperatae]ORX40596.1 SDA1-domain-containing protein [Kockovaella imperatae]
MVKQRNSRGILLTSNLPQLQNLIKRDPKGYKEEFLSQYNHYLSLLRLHSISTSSNQVNNDKSDEQFANLVTFVSQVAQCYPEETKELPEQLKGILLGSGTGGTAVRGDLRETAVKNLIMLRNKEVIDSIQLLQILLPLLAHVPSSLRSLIRHTILTDLKTSNQKAKNHRLNRVVQSLLFGMVESGMGAEVVGDKGKGKANKEKGGEAMWAVMMVRELWKKGVWNDAKTVSIVALAAFHPNTKVQSAAMHFFLGSEHDADEEDSDDEEAIKDARKDVRKLEHRSTVGKGSRKKEKQLALAKKDEKKKRKNAAQSTSANFPALELLHDPQTFGEKLYDNLHKHDKQYSLEHKVLIMQLLSRVMGAHKLCILGFYTYIIKYMTYHQLQVTTILVALAQSVHELTPPDVLTPVIRKIAQEFVHPGVGAEVIAAGLNSIREVCRRQPWCMEEDLLEDLIEYRKSKDKGVITASRGLLQLFREVNPGMLKKRERGKAATMGENSGQVPEYGHTKPVSQGIEGLELLEDHLNAMRREANPDEPVDSGDELSIDEDDEGGWSDWERESESSDSSGWEDVSSGEDDFEVSDSEDEEREKRKASKKGKGKTVDKVAEAEDVDMDDVDDSKSMVSMATTDVSGATKKLSLLAQQKILTPADFALLNELRLKAAKDLVTSTSSSSAKRKLAALEASKKHTSGDDQADRFLEEADILGPRKRQKQDYEERMESIRKGREGRDKFGSLKGKKMKEKESSSTNAQKKRNKPIMMALHSNSMMQKKKASLRDKQIKLRASIEKRKKAKR